MPETRAGRRQDNIGMWTGLSLMKAVRAVDDGSQWKTIVGNAAKPRTVNDGCRERDI